MKTVILVLSLAVSSTALFLSLWRADIVKAGRFELHDADGNVRAKLGFDSDGAPQLIFMSRAGTALAQYEASELGGRITLRDSNGKPRVMIPVGEAGASMVLTDAEGKMIAVLQDWNSNGPKFTLNDQKSKASVQMVMHKGVPGVVLVDGSGEMRARFALAEGVNPTLDLNDEAGKGAFVASVYKQGTAVYVGGPGEKSGSVLIGVKRDMGSEFMLKDQEDRVRLGMFATTEYGAQMNILDPAGGAIWKAR